MRNSIMEKKKLSTCRYPQVTLQQHAMYLRAPVRHSVPILFRNRPKIPAVVYEDRRVKRVICRKRKYHLAFQEERIRWKVIQPGDITHRTAMIITR